MEKKLELLAPGGDIDSIKAAIIAGADAVYCGLNKFNARNRAANISLNELYGILNLAHTHDCKVFLTLNIVILENELKELFALLNKLVNTSIDGVIVQDLGLIYLINNYFPGLDLHASTQLTTHNKGQIKFLRQYGISRVNLSRELNLSEITTLTTFAHEIGVLTEVFIHGSYCLSFSGQCYMSSLSSGRSGNRGSCSQPCRDQYMTTEANQNYPLNLKDNSAFFQIDELYQSGVDSLKIEGRIKEFEYVYVVVDTWRKHLNRVAQGIDNQWDNGPLHKVFNREFSDGFMTGNINQDMFIDNPMNNSAEHHAGLDIGLDELSQTKKVQRNEIKHRINQLSLQKIGLRITVYGSSDAPLRIRVETKNLSFEVASELNLENHGLEALDRRIIYKKLKTLEESEYYIEVLNLDNLMSELYLPFRELNTLKQKIYAGLNLNKPFTGPRQHPITPEEVLPAANSKLAIIVSSIEDLELVSEIEKVTCYYKLPNHLSEPVAYYVNLFHSHEDLIPWFPSILIGEDYELAVELLRELMPKKIVTDNTGIGFEANLLQISWIAGPCLHVTNSYSLLALKRNSFCTGAFISNELNAFQIKSIKKARDFDLFFSIYHPVVLMTSRQCLFHQVSGCEKTSLDNSCISSCEKSSTLTDLKKREFRIDKSRGNYHAIYSSEDYLNTDIVRDLPNHFTSFFIDMHSIDKKGHSIIQKSELIQLFQRLISGDLEAEKNLEQRIGKWTRDQYIRGI